MTLTTFKFDGQRKHWTQFISYIENNLMIKQISYLLDIDMVQAFIRKPVPPNVDTAILRAMSPANRAAQVTIKLDKYKRQSSRYEKNKIQLPLDYQSYLAIIENLLSFALLIYVSHIRNDLNLSYPEKIISIRNYLSNNYGPHNTSDVADLRAEITNANCEKGYHQLLTIHNDCLSQIRIIPKKSSDGHILVDPVTHSPIFHDMSDEELKSILINQLDETDGSMKQLKLTALMNESMTYDQMKEIIKNLLKNAKILNLIGINDPPALIAKIHATKHSLHNNIKNNSNTFFTTRQTQNNHNNQSSSRNNNNKFKLICANCKGDHSVQFCQSITCSTCNKNFENAKARSRHFHTEHSKKIYPNTTITSSNFSNKFN